MRELGLGKERLGSILLRHTYIQNRLQGIVQGSCHASITDSAHESEKSSLVAPVPTWTQGDPVLRGVMRVRPVLSNQSSEKRRTILQKLHRLIVLHQQTCHHHINPTWTDHVSTTSAIRLNITKSARKTISRNRKGKFLLPRWIIFIGGVHWRIKSHARCIGFSLKCSHFSGGLTKHNDERMYS